MTGIDDGERAHTPADADFVQNLAALNQDLDELESHAAAALSDERIDPDVTARLLNAPTGLTYDELTAHNRKRRAIDGTVDVDISELLDSALVPAHCHDLQIGGFKSQTPLSVRHVIAAIWSSQPLAHCEC